MWPRLWNCIVRGGGCPMRRFGVAAVLMLSCSGPATTSHVAAPLGVAVTPGSPQSVALERLAQETGTQWEATLDARFGTAINLEGRTEPLVITGRSTHEQAALGFI